MIMVKQQFPHTSVVGLDVAPRILARARHKTVRAAVDLQLVRGSVVALPYADNSVDRVLSSLVLHHLARAQKQRALNEALRVLRPGGELHIVDFGRPHSRLARVLSLLARRFEEVADNVRGVLPAMLRHAGFAPVEERANRMTILGTVTFVSGRRPAQHTARAPTPTGTEA